MSETYRPNLNEEQFLILDAAQTSEEPPFDNIPPGSHVIFSEGLYVSFASTIQEAMGKAEELALPDRFIGQIGTSQEEIDIPTIFSVE